ncbi:prophage tail fiber N-terminal domain-containing protein [Escherichia coli]|nr:prophage tail fiber N-terminal domain-containing protein [Escherichia coli]
MPQLKGVIKTPTGEPLGGATITLTSLHNRAGILKGVFSHVTTQNGEYDFPVLPGVYSVRLTQSTQRLSEIGVIRVYEDSTDGSLNDFLGATDIDLRPEALKKFEELAQQAQQSAEKAGEHATAAEQARQDTETLAGEIRQDAEEIAGNVQKAEELTSETNQNAARAEQAVKDADKIVQKAVDKLGEAATLTGEAKASAEAAAKSEQSAKQHRDEAQRIVDDLKGSNASTTEKGLVQLCSDTDNDSEELAATPKAVKTVMDETKTKAPLDSPAFTGTPTTPTPPDDAAGLETANAAFVRKLLAALVDSSPEALDTLNELAAALGNDPEFATTIMNALAGKQPLSDVLTAISNLEERADNLLCFNQDGNASLSPLSEKARALLVLDTPEAMRNELELKVAATMEPQSDIRDRTPGRLAQPGAFGFGKAFSNTEALTFNGQADFAEWLKEVMPERYAVSIADSSTLLPGTTKFNGIIDVTWSPFENDESDTTRKFKTLMFYNQYYEGEHSIHRLTYRWSGNNWNATVSPIIYDGDSLAYLLSRMAGSGSYYKYPAVGVPVLAVYQGTAAGDKAIKIGLGDIVPGSRLGPVTITCSINDAGSYVSTPRVSAGGAGAFSFPGRYQALSGFSNSYGDEGRICLFVRIE